MIHTLLGMTFWNEIKAFPQHSQALSVFGIMGVVGVGSLMKKELSACKQVPLL